MTTDYRVVDLRGKVIDPQQRIVSAATPIAAAELVLGIDVVRSGAKQDLVARVYWQSAPLKPTKMLRLYRRLHSEQRQSQRNDGAGFGYSPST